jgi:peptidoglycan/LPS O-acetylase OafA/YrhL
LKLRSANYIPTLDGWRAVAILLVIFDHGLLNTFCPYGRSRIGAHGVEIFFVLSGYLITGKLLEDGSLRKFYTRRAFRILPVLFSYLAVACILGFGLHRIPLLWGEIVSSFLFVRNFVFYALSGTTGVGWFTAHLWSLSVEEQFYLLWPIVMLKVVTGTPRRKLLAASSWFVFWCAVLVLFHVGRIMHFYAGLTVGCLLRLALADEPVAAIIRKIFSGRSAIAVVAMFAYIAIFHYRTSFLDPLICGIGVCATLVEPNAWAGRVLEFSGLRWIGRLSYSLYIWQQLFLGFGVVFRPFGISSRFPVNLVSAVAVSCFSYYLMEKPLMRLGHEITRGSSRLRRSPAVQLEPV